MYFLNSSVLPTDSPNWVVFQPNIIIDAKLGCLWCVMTCFVVQYLFFPSIYIYTVKTKCTNICCNTVDDCASYICIGILN